MSFVEALQEIDLSKNEALIYETLVDYGQMNVAAIARESGVNRRNVYDTLDRLQEKGLVFEIKRANESQFKAAQPAKLREILQQKEQALEDVIPELEYLYRETPRENEVYIYKGVEGWKNYMRDMLRVGEDLYTIGGKGSWTDEKLQPFLENFSKQAQEKEITFHILFDHQVKDEKRDILDAIKSEHRFLPDGADTPSALDIFGDYVVVFADVAGGVVNADSSLTVIKNPSIAHSFRTWFDLLWEVSEE